MTKFGEEGWYYIKWDLGNQNRSIQTRVDKYVDEVKDSSTYPFGNGAFNIGNDTHTTGYIVFNFTDPTASWTIDTPWATYTKDSNNIYYVSGSFLAE